MVRTLLPLLWIVLLLSPLAAQTPAEILVAAYPFQPYFSDKGGRMAGILPELLDLINRSQARWHFRIRTIPASRRYLELEEGTSHLMFFEDKKWRWDDRKVEFSEIILKDSERFLALRKNGRDESFFLGAEDRPLIAVRGYHYQFADHVTEESVLRGRFQIALVQNQNLILEALNLGRGDTTLITDSYFSVEVKNNPRLRDEYLLSLRKDQYYDLRVVFSRSSPVTPREWEDLHAALNNQGQWQEFFRTRGLEALLPQ